MADQNGRAIDEERWRDLPDGIVRLTDEEAREVRALVAADRNPRRLTAIAVLGLETEQQLDAVVVHGAPVALVEAVKRRLDVLRRADEGKAREPLPFSALFRRATHAPNGTPYPEPGK